MAQLVGGRYQLIAQLGGGGMADVYLAKVAGKHDFAKLSVVKRLKLIEDEDAEILSMFADEARLSARLNHPTIVQTFEVGEDENGPFLVMEYIEGQPLGRIRSRSNRRGKPLPRAFAVKIVHETVGALAYAHNLIDHDGSVLHVVHRDVSPENIMVTYAGQTKLVDFGVAKTTASLSKTRAGVLKGKVAYMAPEQARSDENIDARVDIFAIGLILWELLTGRRLWDGMSEAKVFERLLDKEPLQRAREVDPTIPEELDAICAKAIAKDKANRYASATELLEALEGAMATLNLRASDRDIGQFVSTLFEAEREKVRALVAGAMAKKDDSSGPSITNEDSDPLLISVSAMPSSPSISTFSSTAPPNQNNTSSVPAATTSVVAERISVEPELQRTNPAKVVLASLGVAAAIGIALLVGKNLGAQDSTPIPTATPIASQAPPPEIPEVQVDIWVKPATAKLTIDGKREPTVPFHIKAPKDAAIHELKVEAEGYETRSLSVAFDRDRAIDLTLNKVVRAGPTYVAPAVTAPPPSANVAPSAAPSASANSDKPNIDPDIFTR